MANQAYLYDGIRRIETGEVQDGSHAAGIFGRCAKEFESEVRVWFTCLVGFCALDYERDIKAHCKGVAVDKTTLGNLIAGIDRVVALKPDCVKLYVPPPNDVLSVIERLREINIDWVRMKHSEEIGISTILKRMKSMAVILASLTAGPQPGGDT